MLPGAEDATSPPDHPQTLLRTEDHEYPSAERCSCTEIDRYVTVREPS
jgi:hypothetical protein